MTTWRYENFGSANLLSITGTTLTNLLASQSLTRYAFYQTTRAKCFDLPATPEIWIKFDVYFDGSNRWRAYNGGSNGATGITAQTTTEASFFSNGTNVQQFASGTVAKNKLQTVLLHMTTGSADGLIEAWVDGTKLYTYTGDVNHGSDFEDIYLQSDGAGTFFSNVIISNAQIALNENITSSDLIIKPELFISWIPTGKIYLKTANIFASYIPAAPHIEKVSASLKRALSANESTNAPLLRQTELNEVQPVNLSRSILTFEKITADTSRRIGYSAATANLQRSISKQEKIPTATKRVIVVEDKFSAVTLRNILCFESAHAKILRALVSSEKISADLLRSLREFARADTFRQLTRSEKAKAGTVIRIPHILNYFLKPQLLTKKNLLSATGSSLVDTFASYGVTDVNITLSEKTLSDNFSFSIATTPPLEPMNINEAVEGTLLDYQFAFLAEETTQTDSVQTVKGRYNQDDILYTWFTLKDSDLISEDSTHVKSATEIISEISGYMEMTAVVEIEDFTPTLQGSVAATYSDILSSLFGWTSQLPHRQINVFIRGSTLYCIQRGKETNTFDISNLPHSRPTVNKKFNRVLCFNPNKDDNDEDEGYLFNGSIAYTMPGIPPFSSIVRLSAHYLQGLLISEQLYTYTGLFVNDAGETVTLQNSSFTDYTYTSRYNADTKEHEHYLSSKTIRNRRTEQNMETLAIESTTEESKTTYGYSDAFNQSTSAFETYLTHEHEQKIITTTVDGQSETENIIRDTYHFPAGNGWYSQVVFQNNVLQGANLSQGKPGNATSPYTIKKAQQSLKNFDVEIIPLDDTGSPDELSSIVDYSFPVRSDEFKATLNEELRWLHRKTQETVTVDLISPVDNGVPFINHIVDFTEKIILDGATYFLISNNISFSPRKLIQKLTLVRWY